MSDKPQEPQDSTPWAQPLSPFAPTPATEKPDVTEEPDVTEASQGSEEAPEAQEAQASEPQDVPQTPTAPSQNGDEPEVESSILDLADEDVSLVQAPPPPLVPQTSVNPEETPPPPPPQEVEIVPEADSEAESEAAPVPDAAIETEPEEEPKPEAEAEPDSGATPQPEPAFEADIVSETELQVVDLGEHASKDLDDEATQGAPPPDTAVQTPVFRSAPGLEDNSSTHPLPPSPPDPPSHHAQTSEETPSEILKNSGDRGKEDEPFLVDVVNIIDTRENSRPLMVLGIFGLATIILLALVLWFISSMGAHSTRPEPTQSPESSSPTPTPTQTTPAQVTYPVTGHSYLTASTLDLPTIEKTNYAKINDEGVRGLPLPDETDDSAQTTAGQGRTPRAGATVNLSGLRAWAQDISANSTQTLLESCWTVTPQVLTDRYLTENARNHILASLRHIPKPTDYGIEWASESLTIFAPWQELRSPYSCPFVRVNNIADTITPADVSYLIERLIGRYTGDAKGKTDTEENYPLLCSVWNDVEGFSIDASEGAGGKPIRVEPNGHIPDEVKDSLDLLYSRQLILQGNKADSPDRLVAYAANNPDGVKAYFGLSPQGQLCLGQITKVDKPAEDPQKPGDAPNEDETGTDGPPEVAAGTP
ncbi:MAG: hypothetical protein Q4G30_01360 [Actinomycetaceae bacterium]|nr:hypothetical protein [Actinomycetaceae bacterium]